MSSDPPLAAGLSTDERQPLLGETSTDHLAEEGRVSPKPQPRNWIKIATLIFLWVLGGAVLAVFIKGFLDADDVDVRATRVFGEYVANH
ncbi:hypothetical protein H0H92_013271 [Tricholoma furcatifolium]|nr:hypothetical protein H0H92_013271 [Tricholoma furcatifolium]